MNNPSLHHYSEKPVYENHAHLKFEMPVEETADIFRTVMQYFNYGKMQLCAMPFYDRIENYKAFYVKSCLSPSIYVSAGLDHHYGPGDTQEYYLSEIRRYHAMGCDGIKMLEGKMKVHRKLDRRLDDPVFDKFFAYAEENRIPIIMHLGDPLDHWDLSKLSQYAIDNGWYCDENDPTREELRGEVDGILEKFPKLHLILAHFYFMSDELERTVSFLDKWENVCFDLTPGGIMFAHFTERWEEWRSFFEKYQDRLLYGTDTYNFSPDDLSTEQRYGTRPNLVRTFLEKTDVFSHSGIKGSLKPFGLSDEILDKIYRKNFVRLYGDSPRSLNVQEILGGARSLRKTADLNTLGMQNLDTIIRHFESM